jgi:hypothetical protein
MEVGVRCEVRAEKREEQHTQAKNAKKNVTSTVSPCGFTKFIVNIANKSDGGFIIYRGYNNNITTQQRIANITKVVRLLLLKYLLSKSEK